MSRLNRGTQSREELERTAWHEAGHALFARTVAITDLESATIVPDGDALGRCTGNFFYYDPDLIAQELRGAGDVDDRAGPYARLLEGVMLFLAGRAAESVRFGRVGAIFVGDDDMTKAADLMDVIGPGASRGSNGLTFNEDAAEFVRFTWRMVRGWLADHRPHLAAIARLLLRKRTVLSSDIEAALRALPPANAEPIRERIFRLALRAAKRTCIEPVAELALAAGAK